MDMLFGLAYIVMSAAMHISSAERLATNRTCEVCDCSVKFVVNCSSKGLEHIPDDIDNNTKVLDLSSNYLQHIDEGSFESLTMLESLNLYNTSLKLSNVSSNAFKGLSNLRHLDISQNDQFPLTNVSTHRELFEHVPSLEVLRMYGATGTYNVKDGYPDEQLSKMQNLRELWIDGFTEAAFGLAFRNMTSLRIVRLSGDRIEPSWRSNEFCLIENLTDGMLDNLITVTHFYLRKCNVKTIGRKAFKNMINLEYLDMSMNKKLGFKELFLSFCSLPRNTTSLILNEVATRSSKMCGNHITNDMAFCIKDKPIRELQLNQNVIYYVATNVFSLFPQSIEIISATKNEFHSGLYMFFVSNMKNLKRLDMSYQFFTDHTSYYSNRYEEINLKLEISSNNNDNQSPLNQFNDIHAIDGQRSNQENSLQRYKDDISVNNIKFVQNEEPQYKTYQISAPNTDKVCPQLNKDNYIPPGTVLFNIPPKLEYLDLSHSKLAYPILEAFVNETNNLQNINASNSLLYCWDGPFHGLTKLKILDLSHNLCTNVSKHFFGTLTNLNKLNISLNFLGTVIARDAKGQLLANLTRLESLDVSFNLIQHLPVLFLKTQKELRTLIGKINLMEEFNIDISHMTKLEELDLRVNRLRTLSPKLRKDLEMISTSDDRSKNSTLFVNLRANPVDCSCDNVEFIRWLYIYHGSSSGLSVNASYCFNYENHRKRANLTSQYDLLEMINFLESHCRSYTSLIVGLSVTLVIMINVILGIIVHRFRWKLQYWYYVVFKRKTEGREGYELIEEPRYKYDVFVASPEEQKEFVIDKLRPAFKRNGLMAFIAVYHKNFNDPLVHIIGKAINESKVILFVLSNDWSTDQCMNIAVHMWQCDMIQRNRRSVLGVYLNNMTGADAVKVREIYCSTFIDFPGDTDEEEQAAFWYDCVKNIREQGELL